MLPFAFSDSELRPFWGATLCSGAFLNLSPVTYHIIKTNQSGGILANPAICCVPLNPPLKTC